VSPVFQTLNEFLNKIEPVAKDNGITLAQLVIYWTIKQPAITSALVGARNSKQVIENLKAGEINIVEGDILTINKHLEDLSLDLNV